MLIDTHAHVNFSAFKEDADKVIKRCLSDNVFIINVGSQYETSKIAVELAEKYEKGVYAAVGMHPIHVETGVFKPKLDPEEETADTEKEKQFNPVKYKELAKSKKVVAIGETGLDYYYRPKTKTRQEIFKQEQKKVFLEHLNLAKELDLPVIFHCRMAHQDLITTLQHYNNTAFKGVVHCFSGTIEQAKKYLEMGFYLGFTGIIFKLDLDNIIKETPIEKILIETDCPYLTPPEAGAERNEPIFVKYIVKRIAELKNLSFEDVAKTTTENAKNLFKI